MTYIHGANTVLILDGNDLSLFINESSWEDTNDTHDVTCYGAGRHAYAYGLGDGSLSVGGVYDDTNAGPKAIIEPIKDAKLAVTLIRRPEGTGTGKPQESVSVIIEKYVESTPVADMIKWSCDMKMSGTLTRTTQ